MTAKFGTSGLRGLAEELIGDTTKRYVAAFVRSLLATGHIHFGDAVFVGCDFRASSPAIVGDVVSALHAQGLKVKRAGNVPTQALALMAMSENAAAIMVTGSHIPGDRNGIKFYRPEGEIGKLDEQYINNRAKLVIAHQHVPTGQTDDVSRRTEEHFIERYAKLLKPNALGGMVIGVYQHSTVLRDLLVQILEQAGATVEALGRSKHFIPVDTEAVSLETQAKLKAWAKTHKFDAIVSADGDGDRPLVADETGAVLRGDLLGLITAKFLKAKTIVTPITSNSSLERNLSGTIVRTRVGSPYVIAAMNDALTKKQVGVVGFEANGGFLLGSDFKNLKALPTRDSVLPILATLQTAKNLERKLSELPMQFPMAVALSDRLENYPVERSRRMIETLSGSTDAMKEFLEPLGTLASLDKTDGLRATLTTGEIIHLRPSGNAPEFRCYVEASTMEAARVLLKKTLARVDKSPL